MEERRNISRVDYSAKGVVVICDTGEKYMVETKDVSPLGMGLIMPPETPDIVGKDIIIAPSDEDHFRTTVTVAVSNHFLGWIISLGGSVRIVGPESVTEQMRKLISDQAELY